MTIAYSIERQGPKTLVAVAGVSFVIWGNVFFEKAVAEKWAIDSLYSAIFDVSSIVCAFLFSFLIFIKTTENRFLSSFRQDRLYGVMTRDFLASIFSSFILTVVTIPLIVVVPKPELLMNVWFLVVLIWFCLVGYVIACTFRSGYQFIAVLESAYGNRFEEES